MTASSNTILEVRGVSKSFPGVQALSNVSLDLRRGEVLALVGENGAGKSTLMKILGGVYRPDRGSIRLEGRDVDFHSVLDATGQGISVVFQELSLSDNLSVAENIYANRQPTNAWGIIATSELNGAAQRMLDLLEVDIDPRTPVRRLSIADQQVVEILKAMSYSPKILLLDEPTSSLAKAGVRQLFKNVRRLKQEGISIIYITHLLSEIFEVADRVTVLRDGAVVGTREIREVTQNDIVRMMVGRDITDIYGRREATAAIGEVFFEAKGLGHAEKFSEVSFSLRRGEILGISGLIGSGRTEVFRSLIGVDQLTGGEIRLEGVPITINSPKDAIRHGIGYLSENRKLDGLFLALDIKRNLVAPKLEDYARALGILDERKIARFARDCSANFNIVAPTLLRQVVNLSGGNQQKVLLSMWMGIGPRVLVVDEPTKGVDIGAKTEIYAKLRELAAQGIGVVVISSDLPEVIGLSDRVLVMRHGRVVATVTGDDINEETIISHAAGISNAAQAS